MIFNKQYLFLIILAVITACGQGEGGYQSNSPYQLGDALQADSVQYDEVGTSAGVLTLKSENLPFISVLEANPFQWKQTFINPFENEDVHVFTSKSVNFVIVFFEDEYAVVKHNGKVVNNPVPMAIPFQSVIYDVTNNILVLADEFNAMLMVEFNEDGDVINSFQVGNKLSETEFIRSGHLLRGGQMLVASTAGKLRVIDLVASIQSQQLLFLYNAIQVSNAIVWARAADESSDTVIVLTDQEVHLIDIVQNSIIDSVLLNGEIIGFSSSGSPHILLKNTESNILNNQTYTVLSDETHALKRQQFYLTNDVEIIHSVYFYDEIVLRYRNRNQFTQQIITKLRLTDNFPLAHIELPQYEKVLHSNDFLFIDYESVFGYVEKIDITAEETVEVASDFNAPLVLDVIE